MMNKTVAEGSELAQIVSETIIKYSREAIEKKGVFNIALSGGSLVDLLASSNFANYPGIDYSRWKVFLADERCVPIDDKESTFGAYQRAMPEFVSKTTFPAPFTKGEAEQAARSYEEHLVDHMGHMGHMDLVILGLGPDGHTASLFPPVTESMLATRRLIEPVYDSPKPPSTRITMTFYCLSRAAHILFVACGSNKAEILKHIPHNQTLPPSLLPQDRVHWFLDILASPLIQ